MAKSFKSFCYKKGLWKHDANKKKSKEENMKPNPYLTQEHIDVLEENGIEVIYCYGNNFSRSFTTKLLNQYELAEIYLKLRREKECGDGNPTDDSSQM